MPIVGGLDIHRKQITFDYLDTVTGQVWRGRVSPADREHLRPGWPGSPAVMMPRSRRGGAPDGSGTRPACAPRHADRVAGHALA
jgi:hypothetical protein